MTCGIYLIENKQTGQKYIGQSVNIENRWRQHIKGYNYADGYIDKAISKYGSENFKYIVLEELPKDVNILNKREKYWIEHYNTFKDKKHYNLVIGGEGLGKGEDHPSFKKYYRIRAKGSNSANHKNYALINPDGKDIKYSINRSQLENDILKLENNIITEEELLKKHYRVVKHGFSNGRQRYVLIAPDGMHLKNSIYQDKLIKMALEFENKR